MRDYALVEECFCEGVKVGEIRVYHADFQKIRDAVLLDPLKHGYGYPYLDALYFEGYIDQIDLISLEEKVFVGNTD